MNLEDMPSGAYVLDFPFSFSSRERKLGFRTVFAEAHLWDKTFVA